MSLLFDGLIDSHEQSLTSRGRASGVGGGYNITAGFNSWTNEACE